MIRSAAHPTAPATAVTPQVDADSGVTALQHSLESVRATAARADAAAVGAERHATRSREAAETLASGAERIRELARKAASQATAADATARRAAADAQILSKRARAARAEAVRADRRHAAICARLIEAQQIQESRRQHAAAQVKPLSPEEALKMFSSRRGTPPPKPAASRKTPSCNFPTIEGYRILERTGQDSVGEFFRARQVQLGRAVLLKVLHVDRRRKPQMVKAFLDEARSAARFSHPNLLRVHDLGRSGDQYFYTTELIEGPSVASLVNQVGPFEPDRAHRMIRDLTAGVAKWQEAGLAHGRINAESVVLVGGGVAKLTELGIPGGGMSPTPLVPGTVNYVAPELAAGGRPDPRADEYSLAALFFFMLTGRRPHAAATFEGVLRSARRGPYFLEECAAGTPKAVLRLLRKALAVDPQKRHGGPTELLPALDLARKPSDAGIATPRLPLNRRTASRRRRREPGRSHE